MERGRRLTIAAVGLAVTLLTAALVLRMASDGGRTQKIGLDATPTSLDALTGDLGEVSEGGGIEPGPPQALEVPYDPVVPAGLGDPVATLPAPGVATIPLPDLGTGQTTPPRSSAGTGGPAFTDAGVWVVKADGSSPFLVARGATAGVGAGRTWVAFVEGGNLMAAPRSDLRSKRELVTGIGGTAAQGMPISGGSRGVAFLRGGRAVLVDPAAPGTPVVAHEAPGADAIAAEDDGEGRLAWADDRGLHLGAPESVAAHDVQRGMLALGHGFVAHLQDGQVAIRNGPRLAWGQVDRLQTGEAGLVAASGGRVHVHTRAGEDRVFLDRATTPVVTATRILYVSSMTSVAAASLTGIGVTRVATASPGRTITNLDLLDDATLVVTVA